ALGERTLRARGPAPALAGHLAREGIGRRGRHAEQRCRAQELAPVDLALRQLALQDGDIAVLAVVCHRYLPLSAAARRLTSTFDPWGGPRPVDCVDPRRGSERCQESAGAGSGATAADQ